MTHWYLPLILRITRIGSTCASLLVTFSRTAVCVNILVFHSLEARRLRLGRSVVPATGALFVCFDVCSMPQNWTLVNSFS